MHAALEVGGTHVVAATVDVEQLRVTASHRLPLDSAAGAEEILGTLARAVEELGEAARGLPLAVAIPGPFDYERGIGDFDGVAKFGSLHGVDVRSYLEARLGTSATFVNDVTAYAIGQYELMDRPNRLIALALGTGVGSCFLVDGRPVDAGPSVPPHGWVYLLEHAGRPIEETFSRRAIAAAYQRATGKLLDVRDVAELARTGDDTAGRIMQHAFTALAETLAPWVTRFGADVVVIGGSIVGSWDLVERWFIPLFAGTSASSVPVIPGAANEDAALLGAAHPNARPIQSP